jgi:hypothetical protein
MKKPLLEIVRSETLERNPLTYHESLEDMREAGGIVLGDSGMRIEWDADLQRSVLVDSREK